jgi:uncharacterized membrane-anchored protein
MAVTRRTPPRQARVDEGRLESRPEGRLPVDTDRRRLLHDEIHARPVAPLRMPALVTQVAVLNHSLAVQDEFDHLRRLAEAFDRPVDDSEPTLVHLPLPGFTLRWERHGEYSLYAVTQPVDPTDLWEADDPDLLSLVATPPGWLAGIPGQTLVALQVLVTHTPGEPRAPGETGAAPGSETLLRAQRLLGSDRLLGSAIRDGSAQVFTTYRLRDDGTSRFLVLCGDITEGRAGRTASGLADLETYRTLAMMAFPAARELQPRLSAVESRLAELTRAIDEDRTDDAALLHELMRQAAQVETDMATYSTRFAATHAYHGIVQRVIEDLRGTSVPGLNGVFTYLNRRLVPAMATVEATSDRLSAVAEHLGRAADLLRTRVDITTEAQNTELLRSLSEGQRTQLLLQETVEGLSIAAISYYVLGIVGYLTKGLKASGLHVNVDLVTGVAIPFVVAAVWWTLHRTTRSLRGRRPR